FQDGQGNLEHFKFTSSTTDLKKFPPERVDNYAREGDDLIVTFHTASQYWELLHPDGVVSRFDAAGFLSTITDLAGNKLAFQWQRAVPAAAPVCAPGDGVCKKAYAKWLYDLIGRPIGQRRRLVSVTDAARTVNYI